MKLIILNIFKRGLSPSTEESNPTKKSKEEDATINGDVVTEQNAMDSEHESDTGSQSDSDTDTESSGNDTSTATNNVVSPKGIDLPLKLQRGVWLFSQL